MNVVRGAQLAAGTARSWIAFTLVEDLVVVFIISLLVSLLMPSLSEARESTRAAVCAPNQRQLAIAPTVYTASNKNWMNPIEDRRPSSTGSHRVEVTYRVILFPYAGHAQHAFNCSAERKYIYADGVLRC